MTQQYFEKKHIRRLIWPANSPDLNIMENIWSIIDNKLLKFSINTIDDLKNALQTAWCGISQNTMNEFFQSIPERLRQVVNRKGFACGS